MKSSTVRRSALSKESMDVIENLANNEDNYSYTQNNQSDYQNYDNLPNEYVRPKEENSQVSGAKSQEIDLLWQSFKSAQFNSNSPFIHVLGGFIAGVVSTIIVFAIFGAFAINSDSSQKFSEKPQPAVEASVEEQNVEQEQNTAQEEENVKDETVSETVESEPVSTGKTKKYIIKSGDTVEAIIKREYGAYTPERAEAIMKANNLSNLDHISIDQVLLLPLEK